LAEAHRSIISRAFTALAEGRGDELTVSLVAVEDRSAVAVGGTVRDAKRLDEGLRGVLQAVQVPAIADPLEAFVGRPRVAIDRISIEGVSASVVRGRVVWSASSRSEAPPPTEVLWIIDAPRFHTTAGPAANAALRAHATAAVDEARSLAGDENAARALANADEHSVLTLFARPDALGWSSQGSVGHPLVLSVNGADDNLVVELSLDHATLIGTWRFLSGLVPAPQ
jgi:hypothetical protein